MVKGACSKVLKKKEKKKNPTTKKKHPSECWKSSIFQAEPEVSHISSCPIAVVCREFKAEENWFCLPRERHAELQTSRVRVNIKGQCSRKSRRLYTPAANHYWTPPWGKEAASSPCLASTLEMRCWKAPGVFPTHLPTPWIAKGQELQEVMTHRDSLPLNSCPSFSPVPNRGFPGTDEKVLY